MHLKITAQVPAPLRMEIKDSTGLGHRKEITP
jgi:hypothetical protein